MSGSGPVPLRCKPFPSVFTSLCFHQQLVTVPLGRDLFSDFLRPERFVHFSPVPNSTIAFSYVNIAVMEQDRRNEPLRPASAIIPYVPSPQQLTSRPPLSGVPSLLFSPAAA